MRKTVFLDRKDLGALKGKERKKSALRHLKFFKNFTSYKNLSLDSPYIDKMLKKAKYINYFIIEPSFSSWQEKHVYSIKGSYAKNIRHLKTDGLPNLSHTSKLKSLDLTIEDESVVKNLKTIKKLSYLEHLLLKSSVTPFPDHPVQTILRNLSHLSKVTQTTLMLSDSLAGALQGLLHLNKVPRLKILKLILNNAAPYILPRRAQNKGTTFINEPAKQFFPLISKLSAFFLITDWDKQSFSAGRGPRSLFLSDTTLLEVAKSFDEKLFLKKVSLSLEEENPSTLLDHAKNLEYLDVHLPHQQLTQEKLPFFNSFLPKCPNIKHIYLDSSYTYALQAQDSLGETFKECNFHKLTQLELYVKEPQSWMKGLLYNPSLKNLLHISVELKDEKKLLQQQLSISQLFLTINFPKLKSLEWQGIFDFPSISKDWGRELESFTCVSNEYQEYTYPKGIKLEDLEHLKHLNVSFLGLVIGSETLSSLDTPHDSAILGKKLFECLKDFSCAPQLKNLHFKIQKPGLNIPGFDILGTRWRKVGTIFPHLESVKAYVDKSEEIEYLE